jgi:pectinesterase
MYLIYISLYFSFHFLPNCSSALPEDLIVSLDGRGDYTSIQAAIDAAPSNATRPFIILVKNGIYHEKLFIDKPFITLAGEDRYSTHIIFAELRSNWRCEHGDDDWGSAVVNIGDRADDFTLANLTVHNNYGELYGNHDHQFALRSFKATRIILINCNIKADGGDTVSLWNKTTGMYYHADCHFEGWVDYVCPRGWCYITDCNFFGYNIPSASIWHDGSNDEDQKLVIRYSFFDGVPGFPLGRNHRDGQFYLLDCEFSENMADRPIYQAKDSTVYRWGKRYYYYNNHRRGGDYVWYADNLREAKGSPAPEDINALWTFNNQWDPEKNIPAVIPVACRPVPRNGGPNADLNMQLTWLPARQAKSYKVHFSSSYPPAFMGEVTAARFMPGKLEANTKYYWRIDVVTAAGIKAGKVWSFHTKPAVSENK